MGMAAGAGVRRGGVAGAGVGWMGGMGGSGME